MSTATPDLGFLREVLEQSGYSTSAVSDLGKRLTPGQPIDDRKVARYADEHEEVGDALRLFVLARSVSAERLRKFFGSEERVSALVSAGLLLPGAERDTLRSDFAITPKAPWLVFRDFDPVTRGRPMDDQYVMGVSESTMMLAHATVHVPGALAMDLGCGGGALSLFASEWAGHVIGTDINPRALRAAHFGKLVNRVSNVEFVDGSMYEPVRRREFDVIFSNPPFVISPGGKGAITFRDGGQEGHAISEMAVRGAAAHLKDGGYATVMCNWAHEDALDWEVAPRQWTKGLACDAWIAAYKTSEPTAYARTWLTMPGTPPQVIEERLEEWLRYYAANKIGAMTLGCVVLRKRSSGPANWCRTDGNEMSQFDGDASDQIKRLFANFTTLAELLKSPKPDGSHLDPLLEMKLSLTPEHEMVQSQRVKGGVWKPVRSTLAHTRGYAMKLSVDANVALVLARCDGTRPFGVVARELATELGVPLEHVVRPSLPVLVRMMERAFVFVV